MHTAPLPPKLAVTKASKTVSSLLPPRGIEPDALRASLPVPKPMSPTDGSAKPFKEAWENRASPRSRVETPQVLTRASVQYLAPFLHQAPNPKGGKLKLFQYRVGESRQ